MCVIFSNINFPPKSLMVARAQSSRKRGLGEFCFTWVSHSLSIDPSLMTDCSLPMSGKDELLSLVVWIWNSSTGSCIKHTVSTWKLYLEKYNSLEGGLAGESGSLAAGFWRLYLLLIQVLCSLLAGPQLWEKASAFCYWYRKKHFATNTGHLDVVWRMTRSFSVLDGFGWRAEKGGGS